jgi:NADH-quinone oxidoreductase subunit L
MALPLIILATITVVLGFFETPIKDFLEAGVTAGAPSEEGAFAWSHAAAMCLAAAGVAVAWFEFGRRSAKQIGFVERIPLLYGLFAERWYIDRFYGLLVSRVIDKGISFLCYENDNKVIDRSIDELCWTTVDGGRIVAFLQSGMIQYRLLVIFAVMVLLAVYFFFPII